jgi:hypothetical protein
MDLKSLRSRWNEAALPQIPILPFESQSRTWPLLGMLALGLVAGAALGGYAVSQRSQINRLALHARRMRDEMTSMGQLDEEPVVVTTHRSNHRPKTTSEARSK